MAAVPQPNETYHHPAHNLPAFPSALPFQPDQQPQQQQQQQQRQQQQQHQPQQQPRPQQPPSSRLLAQLHQPPPQPQQQPQHRSVHYPALQYTGHLNGHQGSRAPPPSNPAHSLLGAAARPNPFTPLPPPSGPPPIPPKHPQQPPAAMINDALLRSTSDATAVAAAAATDFPVLPVSPSVHGQQVQTGSQVAAILSLPPTVLAQLARTPDLVQQQVIASNSRLDPYLPVMALSAPPANPALMAASLASTPITAAAASGNYSHPGIPHILHQVFSPSAAGILAPSYEPARSHEYAPDYRSVDEWAIQTATRHSHVITQGVTNGQPLDGSEMDYIANQLKAWALHTQDAQVEQHVQQARAKAVMLAATAQAVNDTAAAGRHPAQTAAALMQNPPDLAPYAVPYKAQLAQIASGFYSQLHSDAMRKLHASPTPAATSASSSALPSTHPAHARTSVGAPAMNVQAAAVAALTANVMAATELASRAGKALNQVGVPVSTALTTSLPVPGPTAIEATRQTLAQAQQQVHALALQASANGYAPGQQQQQPHQQQQHHQQPPATQSPRLGRLGQGTTAPPPAASAPPAKSLEIEKLRLKAETGECSDSARNYLLAYAHSVYSRNPAGSAAELLPLLHTLRTKHKEHLPTLLLLSCVYYSEKDYEASILYNEQILAIDPNYVEAMSNIGTTKRAQGLWREAEEWWWRAIELRSTYFDAFDNLLGVLCTPQQARKGSVTAPAGSGPSQGQPQGPRYEEALRLCLYVEERLFGPPESQQRPLRLLGSVPPNHVHRVQNLFYAKGNLRVAQGDGAAARDEYEKALEIAFSPARKSSSPATERKSTSGGGHSLVDVILATVCVGLFMMAVNANGKVDHPAVWEALASTGIWDPKDPMARDQVFVDPLAAAKTRRATVRRNLLAMGGGVLPCVLLMPENLEQLAATVFNGSGGVLPILREYHGAGQDPNRIAQLTQPPNQTTSTVLLTLAKFFQDAIPMPEAPGATFRQIPPSASLLLPLYYLSITLHPSPSTCNNLGILLSTIPSGMTITTPAVGVKVMNGQNLAHAFYVQGLQKDPHHPHLYTNLGSLLKDMGRLPEAVQMYEKAVQCNPDFDVALANLANAIKDQGRVQDSVQWYMRAVKLNPEFPEAVCGLVNALGGVCDWRDRGAVGDEVVVDAEGQLGPPPPVGADGKQRAGWMGKVSLLVDKQLDQGAMYGRGVFRLNGSPEAWLRTIHDALVGSGMQLPAAEVETWRRRLATFFGEDRPAGLNEGGFLIRVVERTLRRTQRQWYLDTYGKTYATDQPAPAIIIPNPVTSGAAAMDRYRRLALPSSLSQPPVPTVLPFHTFTYPLRPRECRLISHRNALRISMSTLTQPWLPYHVFPPPPPPAGKLNIGYVSSDFNNHPLAHLMQSVFGMHNFARYNVFCYATTPPDGSQFRRKIEAEAMRFLDVSSWTNEAVIKQVLSDQIHILVNLNGYTKGARNEIFAARPCPVQMEFMGFAGTIASGWTDWIIADPVVCPPGMVAGEKWRRRRAVEPAGSVAAPTDLEGDLDPEASAEDWVYTEKFVYMPHSYFVCDHKQGFRDELIEAGADGLPAPIPRVKLLSPEVLWAEEEIKRWRMRKEMFPALPDDFVLMCNFNQLYKIDPLIFKVWLNILKAVPKSVLWLLRFPAPGEPHLKATAERWAGPEVASRIWFTDVAPKHIHIQRGRAADLFLDSIECNAHTTAADILWTGTPILTLPRSTHKHKMCSRVAASIALATGFGPQMIADSVESYERRAVALALGLRYQPVTETIPNPQIAGATIPVTFHRGTGELAALRRSLFRTRESSPLFDTARWTRNLEQGYEEAWKRYVDGTDCEDTEAWRTAPEGLKASCSIWVADGLDEDLGAAAHRAKFMQEQG